MPGGRNRGRGRGGGRGRGRGQGDTSSQLPPPEPTGDIISFDGPADSAGPSRSRPQEETQRSSAFNAGLDTSLNRAVLSRNVDLGGNAYNLFDDYRMMTTELMRRPEFGKAGKPATIAINSHIVRKIPIRSVFQYDVCIGSGAEKRGLIKVVSQTRAFKQFVGGGFIFDGNAIGWSLNDLGNAKQTTIDLDAEQGRPPHPRKGPDLVIVRIAKAKERQIHLNTLQEWLDDRTTFNNTVYEAINFLDHLLRETPSKKFINQRRSYFARAPDRNDTYMVGNGVEAMKGVYQSIRAAEGAKMIVNVDVSNTCFWGQTGLSQLAYQISGEGDYGRFLSSCMPSQGREPAILKNLRRLAKNKFLVKHANQSKGADTKEHTIKRVSDHTAKTYKFDVKDRATGVITNMSLFDYYQKKYNIRLGSWQLPLIETHKAGTMFPMELCVMQPGQKFPYKLNETQTANMIKFAVSRPQQRKAAIERGMAMLDWGNDAYLRNYGLDIDPNMLQTKARILDPPEVQYAKKATAKPGFSGRWDLRGKTFATSPKEPLKTWGVCILVQGQDRRPPPTIEQVKTFLQSFINLYRGHGGVVTNTNPPIIHGVPDTAKAIETTWSAAGNQMQMRPQMLMIILPNKNSDVYHRIKKSTDCRYGVMSQCVQASNVLKNQPQYCSNVLMKFNCKLGGTTCTVKGKLPHFSEPTMIIGADVSHPAPGAATASMAAMTVSMDKTASRYAAGVQSNGYRIEMIQQNTIEHILKPLIQHWLTHVGEGRLPKHVYYFRDGVSEGQYKPLLNQEVADIQGIFRGYTQQNPALMPKFTTVVCEKRHHIRFFPSAGPAADKNMNPVPGVVVDHDVTHPFENDIYLCSHAAIQGTARPTHYTILKDEAKVPVDKFQTMLYESCYQYQRATTPVSLFPAVYYAHLAAARGIAHINKSEVDKWIEKREQRKNPGGNVSSSDKSLTEAPVLIPMENTNGIRYGMWYI